MRTTLDLPDDLFREAKIYAAIKGITLKELFTEGLRLALSPAPEKPFPGTPLAASPKPVHSNPDFSDLP